MMRSLYSGVSGLKNHQTRMDVVGNNISNVNTTGFKSGRVTFADTLSQTLTGASAATENRGGTNPKQIGLGSQVSAVDLLFTDGSVQSTGVNTDLCLSGNGLFVVGEGDNEYYTRNGNFSFDEQGNYTTDDGLKVKGWMGTDGTINTSSAAEYIKIPAGKSMASKATQQAEYSNNLNAATSLITAITYTKADGSTGTGTCEVDGTDIISASLTLADGTSQTVTSGKYTIGHSVPVATIITVYDSLGTAHSIPISIEKTSANNWVASLTKSKIAEKDGTTTELTMENTTIPFTKNGAYDSETGAPGTLKLTYGNGAEDQSVTIDYGSLTQYAGSSTVNGRADGNAAGTLKSVSVDSSGVITGTYTNGINQQEAQVAVAQFNNAAGLTKQGGSLYIKSNNSGEPNIKTAADLGCTITPSALEMSNVDLANELSDMIITQRGFQSNSKIITVSDEMIETLVNMKR